MENTVEESQGCIPAVFACFRGTKLTAVVIDEMLQAAELRARRDVEAAAVQLPDLVVLHVQPFGVVIVQHGQAVGTWRKAQLMRGWKEELRR